MYVCFIFFTFLVISTIISVYYLYRRLMIIVIFISYVLIKILLFNNTIFV